METTTQKESVEDLLQDLENLLHNEKNEKTIVSKGTEKTLNFEMESSKYFTFRSDRELKKYSSNSKDITKNNIDKFFDFSKNYSSLNTGLKKLENRIKKGKINLLLKSKISNKINTL